MVLVEYISMQILANSVDNNFVAHSYALVYCLQSHSLLQLGTVHPGWTSLYEGHLYVAAGID